VTTAVDKSPASARLSAVATAGDLPTAPTPRPGTRPTQRRQPAGDGAADVGGGEGSGSFLKNPFFVCGQEERAFPPQTNEVFFASFFFRKKKILILEA
jgi:hypothetical protein